MQEYAKMSPIIVLIHNVIVANGHHVYIFVIVYVSSWFVL